MSYIYTPLQPQGLAGAQDPIHCSGSLSPSSEHNPQPAQAPGELQRTHGTVSSKEQIQAMPGTQQVLHRDPREKEEEVTDSNLSFPAMLFRHLQLHRHQESGSHRFPAFACSFPASSSLDCDPTQLRGGKQCQLQAQPLPPAFEDRLNRQSFRHQPRTWLELTSLNGDSSSEKLMLFSALCL